MRSFILLAVIFLLAFDNLSGVTAIKEKKLEKYLLPSNHPLQKVLPELLKEKDIFDSEKKFTNAGFTNLNEISDRVLVGDHPSLGNYLIKKYPKRYSRDYELYKYLTRIIGAKKVRKLIKKYNLQHIVVPKKWIYQLPEKFNDPATRKPSYILVVEKLDIIDTAEVIEKYKTVDLEKLRELSIVIYHLKGLTCYPRNIPFTRDDKIAFIDTERWQRSGKRKKWEMFSKEQQDYMNSVYKELGNQGK